MAYHWPITWSLEVRELASPVAVDGSAFVPRWDVLACVVSSVGELPGEAFRRRGSMGLHCWWLCLLDCPSRSSVQARPLVSITIFLK